MSTDSITNPASLGKDKMEINNYNFMTNSKKRKDRMEIRPFI